MTYADINAHAYDEARRHFIALLLSGVDLHSAELKREEVYEASRRARCTRCHVEKHVDEFYEQGPTRVQSWCITCHLEYHNERKCTTANSEKWKAVCSQPIGEVA